MPRISVIVPVYKVEEYLHRCVRSIQAQTVESLEIILVDDGSPDGCGRLCDSLAAEDSRIRVIHKENGGLSDARNAGLEVARGEYIGFVDSDDHIAPTMYECLLQALEENGADLSICGYDFVDEAGTADETKVCPLKDGLLSRSAALEAVDTLRGDYFYYVTAWNKLYRRQLWEGLRFPVGRLHEDEFTAHLILERCDRVAVTGRRLYHYVQRSGSIMNSRPSVRSLDGVDALLERGALYRRLGMKAQERNALRTAGWKLGQLMQALPREQACESRLRRLMPRLLQVHPVAAARLWLGRGRL